MGVARSGEINREGERPAIARDDSERLSLGLWQGSLVLPALAFFCFLVTPLVALLWRAIPGLAISSLVADALQLSLATTFVTTAVSVLVGMPTAYLLARYTFPGRSLLNTLVDLPMVLPPAVAGLALLMAFGRRGLLGERWRRWGSACPLPPRPSSSPRPLSLPLFSFAARGSVSRPSIGAWSRWRRRWGWVAGRSFGG